MTRGCWLSKSKAALATGMTPHDFQKTYATKLKERKEGKWPEYFLPEDNMTDTSKAALADCMEELPSDDVADIVEGILGDVTGQTFAATVEDQLQEARLANVKARTAMLGEKLERRKTELFSEWSQAFFEAFTEAFTKFKNELIALQLTEKQLSTLQEKLSLALQSLKDKLDFLEQDYAKDDKEEDDLLNNGEK